MTDRLETILAVLRKQRAARLTTNSLSGEWFYIPPIIAAMDEDWNHLYECRWDHTLASIEEFAEIARAFDGRVTLSCRVCSPDASPGNWDANGNPPIIDDGFEIQVWPTLAIRVHNSFIEQEDSGGDDFDMDDEEAE